MKGGCCGNKEEQRLTSHANSKRLHEAFDTVSLKGQEAIVEYATCKMVP